MDDIDSLDLSVTSMKLELYNISAGILSFMRLEEINKTSRELRLRVDRLIGAPVDESQLNELKREVESVRRMSIEVTTRVSELLPLIFDS